MLDKINVQEIMSKIFIGSFVSSFRFDTSFTISFTREFETTYENEEVPKEFEIILLSDWWFGDRVEWDEKVKKMAPKNATEPEEPVQAYELANLRWMDGNKVVSLQLEEGTLTIFFENKISISIKLKTDMDYSWILKESHVNEKNSGWSICCDNGNFFINNS